MNTSSEYLLFANTQVLDLYVHEHVYMTFGYLQIQFKAQNMELHPGERGLHPGGRPPWDTMGFSQQVGGMHPTGMHPY